MTGTLFGLGIGPGDPDLITVRARDILDRAAVIAYPAPEGGESLVRRIAAPFVPAGRTEVVIATPMAVDRYPAQEVYDRYAGHLADHLAAGRDVALLCEGDPFLYGSFIYLYRRLADRFPCVVVPGVSSLAAVAAVAGRPLCERNQVLTVIPGPLPDAALAPLLAAADAVAIMKVGRHLGRVRALLQRLGLGDDAVFVSRATFADQRVLPLADVAETAAAPYFSMILCRGHGGGRPPIAAAGAGTGAPLPAGPGGRPAPLAAATAATIPTGAALVAVTAGGIGLARRLQAVLPGSRVHGLAGRGDGADTLFADTMTHLGGLFAAGTPIVGVCAAGILIRAVAPHLADKRREPPVVAVAEDGSVAVPLLGGHHGGNELARQIAAALAGVAAITTSGDVRFRLALDAPPAGWTIANPAAVKPVTAALLAGEPVALIVEAGDAGWLSQSAAPFADPAAAAAWRVVVTDRAGAGDAASLALHPPVLAIGIGCERGCEAAEVRTLILETLAAAGLAREAVACLASIDLKMDEAAITLAGAALDRPLRFFTAAELERETPRLQTPSAVVFREVGCHGVAEAAALAAAGADATLVVAKRKSARATCAIARALTAIDAAAVGRGRGRLTVVGIGPGDPRWRSPEATLALKDATDIVGYRLYLDLIADLVETQRLHAPPMTEEEARARLALELAAAGGRVCLVSSGDAGVYGLASLVFELLDRHPEPAWQRLEIAVAPGISALLAAAARAGAPLGHDFCAISLSDLLTPWTEIERRLEAAAAGDFVVALYNPVSQRRLSQLPRAKAILLSRRPPDTPVVLARNLGRAGETIRVLPLAELAAADVDMLTLVVVGSSHTRVLRHGGATRVYTPRGYAAKAAGGAAAADGPAIAQPEGDRP